ncbi:MAG: hydrogenase, partial [Acidobacteria bacterium]|nr:hydrogenase [Acidobacteriota bacterium]
AWSTYAPTSIEVLTLIGSFGLFFTCFLLFCRFVPVIAISEVKGVLSVGRRSSGATRRPEVIPSTASTVPEHKGVPA